MEGLEIKSPVLAKKLDGYRSKEDDFIAQSEITITITLHEYRDLISSVATKEADIKEAEEDKYRRLSEIEALNAEVKELKQRILDLVSAKDEEKEK